MHEPTWPTPQEVPETEAFPTSGLAWKKRFQDPNDWGGEKQPSYHLLAFIEKYKGEIGPDILDIGSGAGRNLIPLAQQSFHLTGLELVEDAIKIIKQRLAEAKVDAKLVRGSFTHLGFGDASFDTVISVQTMQHSNWAGVKKGFSEAARVLKPGKLFFLRINSDAQVPSGNITAIEDRGKTWSRDEDGHPDVHHSCSLDELRELADLYHLDILEYVDEKNRVDGVWTKGQWNIVFRKKAEGS